MSGPKVDEAAIRRQEQARIEAARKRRLNAINRINQYRQEIEQTLRPEWVAAQDAGMGPNIQKLTRLRDEALARLDQQISLLSKGNEQTDTDSPVMEADRELRAFRKQSESLVQTISKIAASSESFKKREAGLASVKKQKQLQIRRLQLPQPGAPEEPKAPAAETVTESDIKEDVKVFEEEITEFMQTEGLLARHKNSMLRLRADLAEITKTSLKPAQKRTRIRRLFEDFTSISDLARRDVAELKAAYEEYTSECFDIPHLIRPLSDFSSIDEIQQAKKDARALAEKQLSKEYIRRQIDEVMAKHGYDVIQSEYLEAANSSGQILYGVDDGTAVDVFVSDENQVTMRVVGIGFGTEIDAEESERLYRQQCAFCSMHPQITRELEMRGVILKEKNHMPPDKKFNKKIQTRSSSGSGRQGSRDRKKRQGQTGDKVRYME